MTAATGFAVPAQQAHVLLHTLGLSDLDQGRSYRNHFVAGDGHHDMAHLETLCALGLMKECDRPGFLEKRDRVYAATDAGKTFARAYQAHQRRERRKSEGSRSKSKSRYRRWMSLSDCFPDLTFKEFLTNPEFKKYH